MYNKYKCICKWRQYNEFNNGQGKHLQKAIERLNQLRELYGAEKLNLTDIDIIEALIQDLEYAINLYR